MSKAAVKPYSALFPSPILRRTHLVRFLLGGQQHRVSCVALGVGGAHHAAQPHQSDRRAGPKAVRFDAQFLQRMCVMMRHACDFCAAQWTRIQP